MSKIRVDLKTVVKLKSTLRNEVAGDFLLNMGMTDQIQIRNVRTAVTEGIVPAIIVTGVDRAGIPKVRYTVRFDPLTDDVKVTVTQPDGHSTIEAVDEGFAAAVSEAVVTMRNRDLRPQFNFDWSKRAQDNPAILEEACVRLGFIKTTTPLPPLNDPVNIPEQDVYAPPSPNYTLSPEDERAIRREIAAMTPDDWAKWRAEQKPPAPPPGREFVRTLEMTMAKDNGIHFIAEMTRRKI